MDPIVLFFEDNGARIRVSHGVGLSTLEPTLHGLRKRRRKALLGEEEQKEEEAGDSAGCLCLSMEIGKGGQRMQITGSRGLPEPGGSCGSTDSKVYKLVPFPPSTIVSLARSGKGSPWSLGSCTSSRTQRPLQHRILGCCASSVRHFVPITRYALSVLSFLRNRRSQTTIGKIREGFK